MQKLTIIVACLLVVSCSTVTQQSRNSDQEIPRATPEEVGMSSEALEKIGELAQQYIDEKRVPGVVVGISRRNKIAYLEAYGVLEEETQELMREDAIFIMASSSKPLVGVAALILVDEGLINLQDPISKYIPEYENLQVAVPLKSARSAKRNSKPRAKDKAKSKGKNVKEKFPEYRLELANQPLTIHHLLTHTAGLGTRRGLGSRIGDYSAKPEDTLASWVPKLAARPLDFHPGSRRAYSPGDGLKVVARVIEIASGMPVNKFIQSRILDPLDMKDTYFDVPENELYRMPSRLHGKAKGDGKIFGARDSSAFVSGAGGLFSTTRDYLRFQQMLLNKGTLFGRQILKPETVAMMISNQVEDLATKAGKGGPGLGAGYTTGITLDQKKARGGHINGTFSWGGAAGTVSWTTPSEELTVVYMVERTSDLSGKIAEVIRDSIVE